ncbi:MAG: M48 family metalloprotease [Candidatus Heimdallarchaeota archaeon]
MELAAFTDVLRDWFSTENLPATLGFIIAIFCGIFLLTELYTVITQKNEPDLVMMLLGGVIGGLIQGFTQDALLAILAALCWLMIFSLWVIRESPVWRELMLASLISYVVVLAGRIMQFVMETYSKFHFDGDEGAFTLGAFNGQQWFGLAWNVFIYVFFLLCIIFFGRRFFLVSRLTSPQIIYLLLFAFSYVILYQFSNFGEDGLNFFYGTFTGPVAERLLFASFGTYEIMILTNFVLYLISGPLLHLIFGVKNIKEEDFTKLTAKIKQKLVKKDAEENVIKSVDDIENKLTKQVKDEQILKSIDKLKTETSELSSKRITKLVEKLEQKVIDRKHHERVLKLVEEVRQKLRIRTKIKVGKVKAPILNAFAFGAFFDKRIAFMSKDLSDFSDDDIRGIAGHELVHSQKIHTFWLLILTALTFAITKALNLPATTLDYIFDPDVGFGFLWYYLYNIALLAFSYIFVRFLEGRADLLTMRAGYGKPLAKSLVKLDGFYQGVASEMGLSVYLLTDKEQTKSEKLRFLGDAGRNMYRNYIKPNVMENFVNLIASHPKSAYRVMALVEQEKLRPFKAALLPFFLLVPFVRRDFIRELHEMREKAADIINETFQDQYSETGIKDYDTLSHLSYQFEYLKGKDIVAVSKIDKKNFIIGKLEDITLSNKITSPLKLKTSSDKQKESVFASDFNIYEMSLGQKQVFKNGKIGEIVEIGGNEKIFTFKTKFVENGEEEIKELKVPGVPISYINDIVGRDILLLQKGITRLAHLDSFELNEADFSASTFIITLGEQTKTISAEKFVIGFKPFDIYLKKGKEKQQRSIIESLNGKPVSLQTKDDLDTLLKGKITQIEEEAIKVETLDEEKEVKLNRLEFLYIYEDSIILIHKPSISFIERIFMFFQNRRKLAYIIT